MKNIFFILLVFALASCNAQELNRVSEKVDWENLKMYEVELFSFKSKQIQYTCTDCKILEIKSVSGVSGYYVVGSATFNTPSKEIPHNSSAALFRFNPADNQKLMELTNAKEIFDKEFYTVAKIALQSTAFKRTYHTKMDAYIPNVEDFSVVLFPENDGEILISQSKMMNTIYFNFTTKQKLDDY